MAKKPKPPARVADLQDKAFRNGIRITDALAEANIAGSTWTRWVQLKSEPLSATLDAVDAALEKLIAEE